MTKSWGDLPCRCHNSPVIVFRVCNSPNGASTAATRLCRLPLYRGAGQFVYVRSCGAKGVATGSRCSDDLVEMDCWGGGARLERCVAN
jgi:hypothetical protein